MKNFNPTFLLIATGTYSQWVNQCKESIKKYFPESIIYLFGDTPDADFKIRHSAWPYVTLYRFTYFLQAQPHLIGDYFYYMDVDAKFVDTPEIKGELVGVRHCAFYFNKKEIPNEPNNRSIFHKYKFKEYYGGGFFGGSRSEFFRLCDWCKRGIDVDAGNNIIPIHNDETAMNAYFSIHPPQIQLTPDYHYPENYEYFRINCWDGVNPFKPKILLLDKFTKKQESHYRLEI